MDDHAAGASVGDITIKDVAATAGVSIATASRALNQSNPSRGEKSDRVRAVAAELGYRRHLAAANLRRGTSHTIGVLVPRLTDTVMALLYEQIAAACARVDRFAIVATTGDDTAAQRRAVEELLGRRVDGLVIASARTDDHHIAELRQRRVPHVLALRTDGDSLAVVGDDQLGGYLAARHLIDLGHRDIGLIAGPTYASSVRGRIEGFHQAFADAGLTPRPEIESVGSFSMEAGEEACRRIMTAEAKPPTALFVMNDNAAVGAMSALTQLGLTIPDDVSVVGYNDIPLASRLPVPLTTLRVPFTDIANAAVDLLLKGPASNTRLVIKQPTLIPRQSTGRPRGETETTTRSTG